MKDSSHPLKVWPRTENSGNIVSAQENYEGPFPVQNSQCNYPRLLLYIHQYVTSSLSSYFPDPPILTFRSHGHPSLTVLQTTPLWPRGYFLENSTWYRKTLTSFANILDSRMKSSPLVAGSNSCWSVFCHRRSKLGCNEHIPAINKNHISFLF